MAMTFALYDACRTGDVDRARLELDRGADVHWTNEDDETPLLVAVWEGQVEAARLLLNRGADVNQANQMGDTALHVACEQSCSDTVRLLLDRGADVHRTIPDGATPLFIACQGGHVDIVRLCLNFGANVDLARLDGTSPLFISCQDNHVAVARLLLDRGAEVDRTDEDGDTALLIACELGQVAAARLLLEYGADIHHSSRSDGATPHSVALDEGHTAMAAWLARICEVGWTRFLSEPKYQLVVLRELVARGQARRAASGDDAQLLDFLFPGNIPRRTRSSKQAKAGPRLPDDLLPHILGFWWAGDGPGPQDN